MAANTIGRNIVFPIYNADGTSFHNLEIKKPTYDSVVMSLSDKITGDVYYKDNNLAVTMHEYIVFYPDGDTTKEGVKFILVNPPTIVREGLAKDNGDLRGVTKYSFEFYHPMCLLSNIPFSDVAVSNDEARFKSQDKTFAWIGTCIDYIDKINKNLENTQWVVIASDNKESREKMSVLSDVLSFDKASIADALKRGYETWGVPYVISSLSEGECFDKNNVDYYSQEGGSKRFVITFGTPSNEILAPNGEYGTTVSANTVATGEIYYSTTPIIVPAGKKFILESLTEDAYPIILNDSHNGVIGTTTRTFPVDTIIINLNDMNRKEDVNFNKIIKNNKEINDINDIKEIKEIKEVNEEEDENIFEEKSNNDNNIEKNTNYDESKNQSFNDFDDEDNEENKINQLLSENLIQCPVSKFFIIMAAIAYIFFHIADLFFLGFGLHKDKNGEDLFLWN